MVISSKFKNQTTPLQCPKMGIYEKTVEICAKCRLLGSVTEFLLMTTMKWIGQPIAEGKLHFCHFFIFCWVFFRYFGMFQRKNLTEQEKISALVHSSSIPSKWKKQIFAHGNWKDPLKFDISEPLTSCTSADILHCPRYWFSCYLSQLVDCWNRDIIRLWNSTLNKLF